MTDLDSWVTSDTTEAEIVDIMKNVSLSKFLVAKFFDKLIVIQ